MSEVTVLGIDIAKSVFQLHGVDGAGRVRYRRQVRRAQLLQTLAQLPRCRIALEACGGAHHWGRQIGVLGHVGFDDYNVPDELIEEPGGSNSFNNRVSYGPILDAKW